MAAGDDVYATVELEVMSACQYPVLELELVQEGTAVPLLTAVEPPDLLVRAPLPWPFTYHLRAAQPGVALFRAKTFGERNCSDYWNWAYLTSNTITVRIRELPGTVYLPVLP